MKNFFYRYEIDGLRSIAVLAVIFYHSQIVYNDFKLFSGGFVGVDIFFVISGYLISAIIFFEYKKTRQFSISNFYERRIRRILPALLLVIIASLPFAWFFLIPSLLVDFANSSIYSLTFLSNFYFWLQGQEYGAQNSLLVPLLHTWSLAVEEQFYIVFPIFLLILLKYLKKNIFKILLVIFFLSLVFSEFGSRYFYELNFYFFFSRIWELLVGAILAYFQIIKNYSNKNFVLRNLMPSMGLIVIVISIFLFNETVSHPSIYTLFPILGTAIFIWFAHKEDIITKFLSTNFFVGIGKISYSLYLWHYPVFAFARISGFLDEKSLLIKFLLIVLTFALSLFSYFFVEKPSRNKNFKFSYLVLIIFFSYVFLLIVNSNIILKKGGMARHSYFGKIDLDKPWEKLKYNNEFCNESPTGCIFNKNGSKEVILVGDSHAAALSYDLKNRVVGEGYSFETLTKGGCLFFPDFSIHKLRDHSETSCNKDYFDKIYTKLKKKKNAIIVFSGAFPNYLNQEKFDNKEGGVVDNNINWGRYFKSNGKF